MQYVFAYFVVINLLTFVFYFIDKNRAIKQQYRTSEKNLLTLIFIGGFIGGFIAIYALRHKNRKKSFMFSFYFLTLLSLVLFFFILSFFGFINMSVNTFSFESL